MDSVSLQTSHFTKPYVQPEIDFPLFICAKVLNSLSVMILQVVNDFISDVLESYFFFSCSFSHFVLFLLTCIFRNIFRGEFFFRFIFILYVFCLKCSHCSFYSPVYTKTIK